MGKKYAIGVDVGGTAIKFGICSGEGDLLSEDEVSTPAKAPKEEILGKLEEIINKTVKTAKSRNLPISAIGIGTPGSVDLARGYLKGGTPNFANWKDVAISDYLEKRVSTPVFADNDANLMAFGEFAFGAGKNSKNAVFVTLGTGIGGGVIIDGEIYRGTYYAGAEIGHMSIDYKGRKCRCGGTGCWEQYASATAMVREYKSANPGNPVSNTKELFERYESGEAEAKAVLERVVEYLGAGTANIINIFNPEIIVIGGGVSQAGEWFIEKIRISAFGRAMGPSQENVEIKAASLGNTAGMLGAAAFALKMNRESGTGK